MYKYPSVLFIAPDGQPFIGFLRHNVCMAIRMGTDEEFKIEDLLLISQEVRERVVISLTEQTNNKYGCGDEREADIEVMYVRRGRW